MDRYEIQVQGAIDPRWAGGVDDLAISVGQGRDDYPVTILKATMVDQAALRGLLTRLWDLNLTILSVLRVESDSA